MKPSNARMRSNRSAYASRQNCHLACAGVESQRHEANDAANAPSLRRIASLACFLNCVISEKLSVGKSR
ncbi:hypothetical protein BO79DRAFT_75008 [Aspergillus costaricaensis CBS 115574]|uniref:Uncharacterized protein n=1 Tax=Aspergillus costaricaensis CBS 115574 TaxID=1448317 RepID=A0ACD1IMC1_9EURO|nr:hypothetical protein BO79DRAFT_75008 [Aspergillus costaricaensis CBS 115574]RAK91399.1 hypothetical protein BO79DRAFT_75008 [Aspergillus costaricaensis CBS 115574]